MAKQSKKSYRRTRKLEIPLAIVAGAVPGLTAVWQERPGGGAYSASWGKMAQTFSRVYFGYNPYPMYTYGVNVPQGFNFSDLKYGAFPLAMGVIAHKVANRFGVNRMLRNAGIPFVRI